MKSCQENIIKGLIILFSTLSLLSCSEKNEANLSSSDIKYIESLGILEPNEEIELFESNGGFSGVKQSGNFITGDRIASYWIEDDESDINSAFFHSDIDSITLTDQSKSLTYASYLTVYTQNNGSFKVHIDTDSLNTQKFFNKAIDNWAKYRQD